MKVKCEHCGKEIEVNKEEPSFCDDDCFKAYYEESPPLFTPEEIDNLIMSQSESFEETWI